MLFIIPQNIFSPPKKRIKAVCETKWLGTLDYNTALSLQKSLHQQRTNNLINDQLLFLEHLPVFTKGRRSKEKSDVLISAVISSYLLNHLHHVLQRAEYGAEKEGRHSQAANFAQLRKVLCMDARSMEDASAAGMREAELDKTYESQFRSNAA